MYLVFFELASWNTRVPAAQRLVDAEQPDDVTERVARSIAACIYDIDGLETINNWKDADEYADREWRFYIRQAKAAIAAMPMREVGNREAELESCLIDAGRILNAIRARDGTWGDFASMYFDSVCDQINRLLGGDWLRAMWKRDAKRNQIEGGKP
jgi:hypothetical protein